MDVSANTAEVDASTYELAQVLLRELANVLCVGVSVVSYWVFLSYHTSIPYVLYGALSLRSVASKYASTHTHTHAHHHRHVYTAM